MQSFLDSIPLAASSPYALLAYAICGSLFIVAGAKLRELRGILKVINALPLQDRAPIIQSVTGNILPSNISAEEWLRNNRNRWLFLLLAVLVTMSATVLTIAFVNRGNTTDPPPGTAPPFTAAIALTQKFVAIMDAGEYSRGYAEFYEPSRRQMSEEQWLAVARRFRAPLGAIQSRVVANSFAAEMRIDRRLNGYAVMYFTKFANLEKPIREVVGLASPGDAVPWTVASYSVDVAPDSPILQKSPP